jgi:hypothetical protein
MPNFAEPMALLCELVLCIEPCALQRGCFCQHAAFANTILWFSRASELSTGASDHDALDLLSE